MSIIEKDKIDLIGVDKVSKEAILTITDHLNWEDELFHLSALQDKINAYLSFIESGEIYDSYPDAVNKSIAIEIVSEYPLSLNAKEFMTRVRGVLYDLDIKLIFEMQK
jgi:hypothetical protein